MKTFIAAALLVSSLGVTAQSPEASTAPGGAATMDTSSKDHADGAVVDPSTRPPTGTSINKQKMEESDWENRKIKDLKDEERKKIDSSSNPIDQIN